MCWLPAPYKLQASAHWHIGILTDHPENNRKLFRPCRLRIEGICSRLVGSQRLGLQGLREMCIRDRIVLEKELSKPYEMIDMVTTPDGSLVAMVHCNNCTSDLNADVYKRQVQQQTKRRLSIWLTILISIYQVTLQRQQQTRSYTSMQTTILW